MREWIREQISVRIESMDQVCFNNAQCKMCGCTTTALQMADKACDGYCYPEMLNKYDWKRLKKQRVFFDHKSNSFWLLDKNNKFLKH